MTTVSTAVKKIIEQNPFLLDALGRGIIHHGNLSGELKPKIDHITGKEINESAIVMALRRYASGIRDSISTGENESLSCEIIMKTRICDFNVSRNPELMERLTTIYSLADLNKGDFLNITVGNHEVSITISEKQIAKMEEFLKGEEILNRQTDLVALTILFSGDFIHTPGVTYQVMRRLAWENINIYEIISTLTELTVVIQKRDSVSGYEVLQQLTDKLSG